MSRNLHVLPHGKGQWQVKGEGSRIPSAITSTQAEAIGIARDIARSQGSEMFIHRPNGQIRERNSYGNDPFPPRG